jgi:hypothetical protein
VDQASLGESDSAAGAGFNCGSWSSHCVSFCVVDNVL